MPPNTVGGPEAGAARTLPARRVVVVEDEPLTRGLLVALLSGAGFRTAEAADAPSAVRLVRDWDPDALVVDLTLAGNPGGAEVLAAADRLAPWTALVVLTNAPTPAAVGIDPTDIPGRAAYLHKRSVLSGDLLLQTLEEVLTDCPPRRDDKTSTDPLAVLSKNQAEVLRLVAEGLSNLEIAARRGTSAHAVELLFQRTLRVLGVPNDPTINARVLAARIYLDRSRERT